MKKVLNILTCIKQRKEMNLCFSFKKFLSLKILQRFEKKEKQIFFGILTLQYMFAFLSFVNTYCEPNISIH